MVAAPSISDYVSGIAYQPSKHLGGKVMSEIAEPQPDAPVSMDATMLHQMHAAAGKASQLLKSLSHPDRLMLLCQLTQGEHCVSQLEEKVGLGQPSLSQQLGILRKDGLVNTRREGKQIYYSVASEDALAILNVLYDRFCQTK